MQSLVPMVRNFREISLNFQGQFVATGSADASIKLLDVQKMKNYNQMKAEHGEDYAPAKPVIRTFYDHNDVSLISNVTYNHDSRPLTT